MHRTTYAPCGHTVEHPMEVPPNDCPECNFPKNWEVKLEEIRAVLAWFTAESAKSDEPDCARAFATADIAVRDCIDIISQHGLNESAFDPKDGEIREVHT